MGSGADEENGQEENGGDVVYSGALVAYSLVKASMARGNEARESSRYFLVLITFLLSLRLRGRSLLKPCRLPTSYSSLGESSVEPFALVTFDPGIPCIRVDRYRRRRELQVPVLLRRAEA